MQIQKESQSTFIIDWFFAHRDKQVMLDRDLAELLQVDTKVINQAVKRNLQRFSEAFRFQLCNTEKNELVAICDQFKSLKQAFYNPYALHNNWSQFVTSSKD